MPITDQVAIAPCTDPIQVQFLLLGQSRSNSLRTGIPNDTPAQAFLLRFGLIKRLKEGEGRSPGTGLFPAWVRQEEAYIKFKVREIPGRQGPQEIRVRCAAVSHVSSQAGNTGTAVCVARLTKCYGFSSAL